MYGTFCEQPWPVNDCGDDPGLSRTVGSGDTAHTAHTVRLPDVILRRFISCDSPNYYLGVLPRKNKFGETRNEALQLVSFL